MNPTKRKTPPKSDGTYIKLMQEAKQKQKKKKKPQIAASTKIRF